MRDDIMFYNTYCMGNLYVMNMSDGCYVFGHYVLQKASIYKAKTGEEYLRGVISDSSGSIDVIMFDYDEDITPDDAGCVVYAKGLVGYYNGTKQLNLSLLRKVEKHEVSQRETQELFRLARYFGQSAIDTVKKLIVKQIADVDYRNICLGIVQRYCLEFSTCPASSGPHHAYAGGLITHSIEVARQALIAADSYDENYGYHINRDLLAAGALLHDIGKVQEYKENDLGLAIVRKPDVYLNHAKAGVSIILEQVKHMDAIPSAKTDALCNMILSHHSSRKFTTGVQAQTPEARLLAILDNLDSCFDNCYSGDVMYQKGRTLIIRSSGVA